MRCAWHARMHSRGARARISSQLRNSVRTRLCAPTAHSQARLDVWQVCGASGACSIAVRSSGVARLDPPSLTSGSHSTALLAVRFAVSDISVKLQLPTMGAAQSAPGAEGAPKPVQSAGAEAAVADLDATGGMPAARWPPQPIAWLCIRAWSRARLHGVGGGL